MSERCAGLSETWIATEGRKWQLLRGAAWLESLEILRKLNKDCQSLLRPAVPTRSCAMTSGPEDEVSPANASSLLVAPWTSN